LPGALPWRPFRLPITRATERPALHLGAVIQAMLFVREPGSAGPALVLILDQLLADSYS
jgi:hypothetical protein